MDIHNENDLEDIAKYVIDIRNNDDIFVPTDMSNSLNNNSNNNLQNSNFKPQIAYLVVDTNFLLSHLSLLDELEKLLHNKYIGAYQIVIPKQVIHELDGLKDSNHKINSVNSKHSLSNLARTSINWCYSHFHDSIPTVTGQRLHERIDKNAIKDNAILDCCLYFQNIENGGNNMVVLLSNDKNLCVKALVNNVLTISYRNGMTAELIANNVVSEMTNNYNDYQQQHQQQPYSDEMGIESYIPYEEQQQISNPTALIPKPITLYDASNEIYLQITQLVLEAIKYAVEKIFGEDAGMVGYNDNSINNLLDASRCIVKMGLSTFSEFFDRRKFNPMKILQDKETMRLLVNKPENKFILKEFVTFWADFLNGIYKDRETTQKTALLQISNHWQDLLQSV